VAGAKQSPPRPVPRTEAATTPLLSIDAIRQLVASARVAHLATVSPDGRPDLVPITYALANDVLYSVVDHKPKSTTRLRRLANIDADPRVTVLIDHYEEDWTKLWWCRLRGTARVDEAPHEDALTALRAKYGQYAETEPTGPFVSIAVTQWIGWTALG
jgi:PPOX class probable F420-dependent enzyme